MSELKETKKMKVVQLHEYPKTVVELYSNPKNSPLGPKKVKSDPKIKSTSKVRIEGTIENKSCSTT